MNVTNITNLMNEKIHNKPNDIWSVTFLKNYYHPELVKNHCIWLYSSK